MSTTYKNHILAAVHETAQDLHDIGLMSKKTMHNFDVACLTEVQPMAPEQIRALRERYNVSQSVFALYLNVTVGLVSKWERGDKRPAGASLKLLTLIDKNGLDAIA